MAGAASGHRHRGLKRAALPGLALALTLASALACSGERAPESSADARLDPDPPATQAPVEAPPASGPGTLGVHGCRDLVVDEDPNPDAPRRARCLLTKARRVSLWLEGEQAGARYALTLDGAAVDAVVDQRPEGALFHLDLETTEGTVVLADANAPERGWTVELAALSSAYSDARKRAIQALHAPDTTTADALPEALGILAAADETVEAHERPLLACMASQLAYEAGDYAAVGEGPEAVKAAARSAGARPLRCLGAARSQAAYLHLYVEPDFNASEAQLAAAIAELDGPFVHMLAELDLRYFQGTLEFRLGHLDEALVALGRTGALAEALDAEKRVAAARVMEATTLARLGRFDEAQVLADALATRWRPELDQAEPPAHALDVLSDLAWVALLRREVDPGTPDPSPQLRALAKAYAARGDRRNASHMHLNLALAAIQGGELGTAERELEAIDPATLDAHYLIWRELLGAQAALGRGRSTLALEHLERAGAYAELTHDREHDWQLWALRAATLHARGDTEGAIAAYERANAIAGELALAIPGDAGRSLFVTSHARADARHLELLVETGDTRGAFCTAVGARARHLRAQWARARPRLPPERRREYQRLLSEHQALEASLAARSEDAWELSTSELEVLQRALASEGARAEALLAQATAILEEAAPRWTCDQLWPRDPRRGVMTMAPAAGSTGSTRSEASWRFFLATADAPVELVELRGALEPEALIAAAVERFAAKPEGAWSTLDSLDVIATHELVAVDIHGLLAARDGPGPRVVHYSLGLGREPTAKAPAAPALAGLDVAVIASAKDLAAAREEAKAVSARLTQLGAAVSPSWSPLDAEQPTLMHYSGHGYHEGLLGWGSYLVLDGQTVRAAQIVAGQRAPQIVVLGACSAGTPSPEAIDGGMNLASAFLLAGAQLVIAPTRPVDDAVARRLAAELYASDPLELSPTTLAARLAEVQRAEVEAGAPDDLRESRLNWRAWTP